MKLRTFTYLLLLLLPLQVSANFAGVHTAQLSEVEHINYHKHEHSHDKSYSKSYHQSDEEDGGCHHCCHCHGHSTVAMIIEIGSLLVAKTSSKIPDFSTNPVSDTFETLFRPPIAKS